MECFATYGAVAAPSAAFPRLYTSKWPQIILWAPECNAQFVTVDGTNLECAGCPKRCAEEHTFRKF